MRKNNLIVQISVKFIDIIQIFPKQDSIFSLKLCDHCLLLVTVHLRVFVNERQLCYVHVCSPTQYKSALK